MRAHKRTFLSPLFLCFFLSCARRIFCLFVYVLLLDLTLDLPSAFLVFCRRFLLSFPWLALSLIDSVNVRRHEACWICNSIVASDELDGLRLRFAA